MSFEEAKTRRLRNLSDAVRRDAELTEYDLWLRYFGLGGTSTFAGMVSHLRRGFAPDSHEHDVLAQALNERFSELGRDTVVRDSDYIDHGRRNERAAEPLVDDGIQLGLLGSCSLRNRGELVQLPLNAQRLICFLALHDGFLLRQHVAGSLWWDTTDERAAGSLRSALWRLRHLASPLLEITDTHLRLFPHVVVDLRASEALARRILDTSRDLNDGDLDDALLASDLLPDWTEDWVLIRRSYHTQLRLHALEVLSRRLSEMGRFGEAVQAGTLAVSGEPLRESAQRALIAAHLAEGNAAAAAHQYESFRQLLLDELGLEPSPAMRSMIKERIQSNRPGSFDGGLPRRSRGWDT